MMWNFGLSGFPYLVECLAHGSPGGLFLQDLMPELVGSRKCCRHLWAGTSENLRDNFERAGVFQPVQDIVGIVLTRLLRTALPSAYHQQAFALFS